MAPAVSGLDPDPADTSLFDRHSSLQGSPSPDLLSFPTQATSLSICFLALSAPSPAPDELRHAPHTSELLHTQNHR